jgi:hypothetical protein
MSGQIVIHMDALTGFQRSSDKHGESFENITRELEQARVGRESFGVMPGSGEMFSGYEERVHSCLESAKECADAVRALGDLVAQCGEEYQRIDDELGQQFSQIAGELQDGAA